MIKIIIMMMALKWLNKLFTSAFLFKKSVITCHKFISWLGTPSMRRKIVTSVVGTSFRIQPSKTSMKGKDKRWDEKRSHGRKGKRKMRIKGKQKIKRKM